MQNVLGFFGLQNNGHSCPSVTVRSDPFSLLFAAYVDIHATVLLNDNVESM